MSNLEKEFKYFIKHQTELVKKYNGKFVVIKGEQVIGVYNSEIEAYTETQKKETLGTFLIQECKSGANSYSQTYHSRVAV